MHIKYAPYQYPDSAEPRIFRESWVSIMVADALAPCVVRSSAVMPLVIQTTRILIFHVKVFKLSAAFQCQQMLNMPIYDSVVVQISNTEWAKSIRF